MEKKTLVVAAVFLFVFLTTSGFIGFILLDKTVPPEEYTQSIVREQEEGLLFDKIIDRIPTRANITSPRIENSTVKVGVSADTSELNFGVVIQNMSVRKFLNLGNSDDSAVKVCIVAYGNISQFVDVQNNEFTLEGGDGREVMIEFNGDRIGVYSGEVDVITKKPKYDFLKPLLSFVAC